jgi:poly(A) polymerase
MVVPEKQRQFAVDVVRKLRTAGFEAYWAGGCVRDRLLGRTPKDYDVATDATPAQIRHLFGRRRTLAIGAAFGVITVRGPRGAGVVEVATFRRDADYSNGRHPDSVRFSTAREDALRRDFTINGLFYDPLDEQVIDFVGGREDLDRRLLRAIGDPRRRFGEDKLRMLRAVRFSATFQFALEADTLRAIQEMAGGITAVSPERIAVEMQQILLDSRRSAAIRLLLGSGLAAVILPEIVPADDPARQRLDKTLSVLERLGRPSFPSAMAALLYRHVDASGAEQVCRRWRLSNQQTDRVSWLVEHHATLRRAPQARWSAVQKMLVAAGAEDLLKLNEAAASAGCAVMSTAEIAWCRAKLAEPREVLDPPPLLTGDDLVGRGLPPGPVYGVLLQRVREAQLDGEIRTKAEAIELVERLLDEGERHS